MIKNKRFGSAKLPLLAVLAAFSLAFIGLLFNPTPPTVAQDVPLPLTPPDAAAGLAIYSDRCVICHGEIGDGQGTRALEAGLVPTALSDPSYRITAVPSTMYNLISTGNIEAGMPPFGPTSSNPLNDADIWNLIALAYSFSTRPADIAAGEALATELGADTTNWPDLDYWFSRSNEMILAELASEDILGVDVSGLSNEEKLSLIDYGRSLNYTYTDPLAAFAPVPLATIRGQVTNGTTNEPVTAGEVRLRAFTVQLDEMFSETVPLNEDGSFEFQVENVPTSWVFLADMAYGDLTFNSNAVQVSSTAPDAQMPLFVYESTADPTVVAIDRLHMILSFSEDRLLVSELYVFSNLETAVFVGDSGDFNNGTVEVGLPAGAENVGFQRGFGTSLDSFIPATEFIQTDTGWADTVPLRPGSGSLNLLVSYDLPYDDSLLLAHPLTYPVSSASAIMADVGVTISDDAWVSQGVQATTGGSFISYTYAGLPEADALNLTLEGKPTQVVDAQGNALPARNQTNELIIGGMALAAMLAVGFFMVQRWRTTPVAEAELVAMPQVRAATLPRKASQGPNQGKTALLQAIAELDDAYDAGELEEDEYQQQRQDLKTRLTAVWQ